MSETTILLGYQLARGNAVRIPVRHMAVVGLTQRAGKTTAMEALIGRSGLRAVTFVTKRGEGAFGSSHTPARRIPAFLRPACDWRAVTNLLEAHLGEPLAKSRRPYLMRACLRLFSEETGRQNKFEAGEKIDDSPVSPQTISDVAANLECMHAEAENKAEANALLELCEYFRTLLPELAQCPTSQSLDLQPGLNLMDLSGYSTALQGLIIGSTLEWINEHESGVIILIPEAQEFIPRVGETACKDAIIRLSKQGGCLHNYLWIDTQELASVATEARKQVSVYLFGVQREVNEVQRTLDLIPPDNRKPTKKGIMELRRGQFWAVWDDNMVPVYVQPDWLDDEPERAREYAMYLYPESHVAPARSHGLTASAKPPRKSKSKTVQPPASVITAPASERVQ